MGTGSFPGVKRPGRVADHPTLLAPRSRMSRAIPLLPLWAFGACYMAKFNFCRYGNELSPFIKIRWRVVGCGMGKSGWVNLSMGGSFGRGNEVPFLITSGEFIWKCGRRLWSGASPANVTACRREQAKNLPRLKYRSCIYLNASLISSRDTVIWSRDLVCASQLCLALWRWAELNVKYTYVSN
jgi:hypothetical protein